MQAADKYCEQIESNLYNFYFSIAGLNGFTCRKDQAPRFVKNQAGGWPSYILGDIQSEDQAAIIKETTARINTGTLPAFWVMKEPPEPESLYEILAESGIRPVTRWTGMMLTREDYKPVEPVMKEPEIRVLTSGSDLQEWTDLINREVFQREIADQGTFASLLADPAFCLYFTIVDGKTVATALAFTHEAVSGLYLISTDSAYRKKGIGRAITSFAVEDCFSRNTGSIVLHGTRAGHSIYCKMGFMEYCNFDIFWMLGKS